MFGFLAGGAVCVLKFMADGTENHKMYPSLAKYVRTAVFCGRKALVMPHFDTPKRDKETLALVKETLENFFCSSSLEHSDVRWRNIGVYKEDAGLCHL